MSGMVFKFVNWSPMDSNTIFKRRDMSKIYIIFYIIIVIVFFK